MKNEIEDLYSNTAAECLLGSLLMNGHQLDDIYDTGIKTSDFSEKHGLIFKAICEVLEANPLECCVKEVINNLKSKTKLQAIGEEYIFDLAKNVPSHFSAEKYALIILKKKSEKKQSCTLQVSVDYLKSHVDEIIKEVSPGIDGTVFVIDNDKFGQLSAVIVSPLMHGALLNYFGISK